MSPERTPHPVPGSATHPATSPAARRPGLRPAHRDQALDRQAAVGQERQGRQQGRRARPQPPAAGRVGSSSGSVCVIGSVLLLLGAAAFGVGYAMTDIPTPTRTSPTETTFVYYADGKDEMGRFASQNRTSIPLGEVPQHVQDAVIAAEDRSFYTNQGIDPKGILRAAFSNARGNSTQGASTITQQYVKVLYLSQERTYSRKVKEAFVSLKLQRQQLQEPDPRGLPQHHLLRPWRLRHRGGGTGVLRQGRQGPRPWPRVGRAGGGAQLPSRFDPAEGADAPGAAARAATSTSWAAWSTPGNVTAEQGDQLQRSGCRSSRRSRPSTAYGGQKGHMLTLVKQAAAAPRGSPSRRSPAAASRSTPRSPASIDDRGRGAVSREQKPQGVKGLHVAVASVEPGTGALRGMLRRPGLPREPDQLGASVAQPGSSFKPFALAAGIDEGYSLKSTFDGQLALRATLAVARSPTRASGPDGQATTTAARSA